MRVSTTRIQHTPECPKTHTGPGNAAGAGESGISAVVCREGARMRVPFSEISCGGLRLSMSFLHLMVSQIGNRNIVSLRHRPNSMIRRAWTHIPLFSDVISRGCGVGEF